MYESNKTMAQYNCMKEVHREYGPVQLYERSTKRIWPLYKRICSLYNCMKEVKKNMVPYNCIKSRTIILCPCTNICKQTKEYGPCTIV